MAILLAGGMAEWVGYSTRGHEREILTAGLGDVPQYWQPLGKRFTGKGGDLAGIRFEDINGDVSTRTP
jgi:hypothetical protein